MRLAFLLQRHVPGTEKARHLRQLLKECRRLGHDCRIYSSAWQGEKLAGVAMRLVPCRALSRQRRQQLFVDAVHAELAREPADVVIGFDKLPGLDLYFATESCLRDPGGPRVGPLARRSGGFKYLLACEEATFGADARTRVLFLSEAQQHGYARNYPRSSSRWQLLPPGVSRDYCRPADARSRRERVRAELAAQPTELLLLFAAPDFAAGGLAVAIRALAAMLERRTDLRARLLVVGADRSRALRRLAGRAGLKSAVQFLGPRPDMPDLLLAADALVHPALDEPGGTVILEALVAGLPAIVTANCGYAQQVRDAGSGLVLAERCTEDALADAMERVSDGYYRHQCQDRALVYASRKDLYSMYEVAAALVTANPDPAA